MYLRLGRVSNLPTVWTNVLAGVALTGVWVAPAPLAFLALALSLFYIGGMYLNDAFDREIDARERPERPIPSGRVQATTVFATGYGLLAAGLAALAVEIAWTRQGGYSPTIVAGICLAGVIIFYDARHKANPWSPLLMGLCRVLVYVTAAFAVAGHLGAAVAIGAVVLVDTRRLADSFPAVDYFEASGLPFVIGINGFHGQFPHRSRDVSEALAISPDVPVIPCDARNRESTKATLVTLVEHAMSMQTAGRF